MIDFHVIIPARLQSTRLPGKLMLAVNGKSILQWVYEQACASEASSVTIAVDHQDLYDLAHGFTDKVVMTQNSHASGSDRVAEAAHILALEPEDLIVNLQADEPRMPVSLINQVAKVLAQSEADLASLYWPISNFEDWQNPNIVKVVCNAEERALYFSRSPIPYYRDNPQQLALAYRHIGLYAYRMQSLQKLVASAVCSLEKYECLEQLRALHLGMNIQMQAALSMPGQDINTLEDYQQLLLES